MKQCVFVVVVVVVVVFVLCSYSLIRYPSTCKIEYRVSGFFMVSPYLISSHDEP